MLDLSSARAALRSEVLSQVEALRPIIEGNAETGQALRTMPEPSWRAIDEAGLFSLKVPAELGGLDSDAVIQIEAIERMAYFDGSAGWTMMVGIGAAAMAAGWASETVLPLLKDGDRFRRGALCLAPTGTAVPVDGGYRVSGRWAFASGSHHAEWVVITALVEGGPPQSLFIDASKIEIEDSWHVTGLKGTGSSHVAVRDLFVPAEHGLASAFGPPLRGGPVLRMGQPGLVVCEHAAFALGVARRMIDEMILLAKSKMRGLIAKKSIADNQHFQSVLGASDVRLRAAREYVLALFDRAHHDVIGGTTLTQEQQMGLRVAAVHATDTAVDICNALARFAGTSVLYSGNILERCLRDINAGAQHHLIAQGGYEAYARQLLGFEGVTALD